jgi:hypothetical protein
VKRLIGGVIVALFSIGMLAAGLLHSVSVYEEDVPEGEFALFEDVREGNLVVDATFSGVVRSKLTGRLITTYDRTQPRDRKACPT